MSLDDELRSAFEQEAVSRHAPPPDPVGLIRGGRGRRRRRNLERVGAGIAAAVVLGAGGWALVPEAPRDPGVASPPSGSDAPVPPPPSDVGRSKLAAGTYRAFVGTGPTGSRIEADFTVDGTNWTDGDFPVVAERYGSVYAGVGVYQPRALAADRGCLDEAVTSDLGRTPRRLADQLAGLPRSTVVEAPTATQAFGHAGFHLRLRIDVDCPTYYRVAESPSGDRGLTYTALGGAAVDVVIDFWVIDVAGAVVVVDQWHNVGASDALVAQAERARESVVLITGE